MRPGIRPSATLGLYCDGSTSGIESWGADHCDFYTTLIQSPALHGIACYDANSFYSKAVDCDVINACSGTSVQFLGYTEKLKTFGSIIEIQLLGGNSLCDQDQPSGADGSISMIYQGRPRRPIKASG